MTHRNDAGTSVRTHVRFNADGLCIHVNYVADAGARSFLLLQHPVNCARAATAGHLDVVYVSLPKQ